MENMGNNFQFKYIRGARFSLDGIFLFWSGRNLRTELLISISIREPDPLSGNSSPCLLVKVGAPMDKANTPRIRNMDTMNLFIIHSLAKAEECQIGTLTGMLSILICREVRLRNGFKRPQSGSIICNWVIDKSSNGIVHNLAGDTWLIGERARKRI